MSLAQGLVLQPEPVRVDFIVRILKDDVIRLFSFFMRAHPLEGMVSARV